MLSRGLRRGLVCAISSILLLLPGNAVGMFKDGSKPVAPKFMPNELIVKINPAATSTDTLNGLLRKHGARRIEPMSRGTSRSARASGVAGGLVPGETYKIVLAAPGPADTATVAGELARDAAVEFAEPNRLLQVCVAPNDPFFSKQWNLEKIQASGGWDSKTGDPSIVIAVVDTGVDWSHLDLSANIWVNSDELPGNNVDDDGNGFVDDVRGWDFVDVAPESVWPGEDPGPDDADPMDFFGHGTHVAGIAAGITNNGIGMAGLAWNCRIMPVRAGYAASDGYGYLEEFDAGRAIRYAADNGANVINMSWGGPEDLPFLRDCIEYAHGKGCLLVAAAGNVTSDYASLPFYPAAYPEVVAVAATDEDDLLSIWSWYVFSNYGDWVDICAPGTEVLSTLPGNTFGSLGGTSMASPHVAGLAALIMAKYPALSRDDVVKRMCSTAVDIDGGNPLFLSGLLGKGRIDARRALGNVFLSIDYPAKGRTVGKKVAIKGSADIENFRSYKLEYGVGERPNIWTLIGNEHFEPRENAVLENWDASALFGNYTIRLILSDSSGGEYVTDTNVNISSAAKVELTGDPIPAPNPFNPRYQPNIKIFYEIGSMPSSGADIDVIVYDITGTPIWRTKKFSASPGPIGDITWDGVDAFGRTAANGVYPLVLASDGRVIGRSKIAIFK